MLELTTVDPRARQLCRIFKFDNSYVIIGKKSDLAQFLSVEPDEYAICVPLEVLSKDLKPLRKT